MGPQFVQTTMTRDHCNCLDLRRSWGNCNAHQAAGSVSLFKSRHLSTGFHKGLVFTEIAVRAAAATAATTRCTWRFDTTGGATLRNGPCAPADQPVHVPAALGTMVYRSIGHLLPLLESAGTLIAEVLVGRHGSCSPVSLILGEAQNPCQEVTSNSFGPLPINSSKRAQWM